MTTSGMDHRSGLCAQYSPTPLHSPTIPQEKTQVKFFGSGHCRNPEQAGVQPLPKALANQRDIPYQSLLKVFLAERLKQEQRT